MNLIQTTLLGMALVLSGCIGRLHTPYQPGEITPVGEAPLGEDDAFAYQWHQPNPELTALVDVQRNYDKVLLEFPPVDGTGRPSVSLSAHYYRSTQSTARKLVIVLPIWGSYRYPPQKVARTLRRKSSGDIHVIEVLGVEPLFYWGQMREAPTEEAFIELSRHMTGRVLDTVVAIRQLLDWAVLQEEIDPDQIGLVGFSMGAIVAAMALGVDQRFAGGVLMMGAAKPGDVFASCNGFPGEVREAILTRFGWSVARYQALFAELFAVGDPANFAGRYKPDQLLIMDGAFDDCMPREARQELWEVTGRPERVLFLAKHKWAFLALTPITFNMAGNKIHEFLSETLGKESQQVACATAPSC